MMDLERTRLFAKIGEACNSFSTFVKFYIIKEQRNMLKELWRVDAIDYDQYAKDLKDLAIFANYTFEDK